MCTTHPLLTLLAVPVLAVAAGAHVEVNSPNGGENLQGQEAFQVDWIDTINHGSGVTYEIEFSADGGVTWTQVVDNLPYSGGSASYTWIVPDQDTTQGRIRVTMHVNAFTTYSDTSNADFAVTASYTSYGSGTPVNGTEPILEMHAVPQAGSQITIHLSQAQVGTLAHIIVGSQQTSHVRAGVTVLNNVDLAHLVLQVDINGEVILPVTLPSGAVGLSVNIQVVIESVPNLSATAGIRFTILP